MREYHTFKALCKCDLLKTQTCYKMMRTPLTLVRRISPVQSTFLNAGSSLIVCQEEITEKNVWPQNISVSLLIISR